MILNEFGRTNTYSKSCEFLSSILSSEKIEIVEKLYDI